MNIQTPLLAIVLLSSTSVFAQPMGSCPPGTPDCPFATLADDVERIAEHGPCAEELDLRLLQKYRSGAKLTPNEFVELVVPFAQASERATGVPASVTIAQAALETGWGRTARRTGNNIFGMKGTGTAGSMRLWTREYYGGRWHKVRAKFAAYANMEDSFIAHARLISEKSRYAKAMAVKDDPYAFARAVKKAGYATDPKYATTLISIMNKRDLTRFDDSVACGDES